MMKMIMQGGSLNHHIYFSPATLRMFLARNGYPRAIGWDLRSLDGHSSAGELFSSSSYGHLGYTGTSIWVDPERELAVILLSNRVYPSSENIKIRKFRPLLHNCVIECLIVTGVSDVLNGAQPDLPRCITRQRTELELALELTALVKVKHRPDLAPVGRLDLRPCQL